MADNIIKQADNWLTIWGNEVKSGNRIYLGVKISSAYDPKIHGSDNREDLADVIDHIVGGMQFEIKRVLRRYYVDEIPGHRYAYYAQDGRTIEMKAKVEKIKVPEFKDLLRIGRHIVYFAMSQTDFSPEKKLARK